MLDGKKDEEALKSFSNYDEVLMAYALKKVSVHTRIKIRLSSNKIVKKDEGEHVEKGLIPPTSLAGCS